MRAVSPLISLVVPCYNEEENIDSIYSAMTNAFMPSTDISLEIVFVNDGSSDRTAELLDRLATSDDRVSVIHLSRNFGHQAAVSAGLEHAQGDAVIVLDADMQDPPIVAVEMVAKWREGADVVYAVRQKRKEGLGKRLSYKLFYRLMGRMSSIRMPLDSGDFGLIDRQALNAMLALPERNRFVRGLRAWVGFKQVGLTYERQARAAGEPKYNFRRLVKLAADGIFNFSTVPLRAIFNFGLIICVTTVMIGLFLVVQRLFDFSIFGVRSSDVPGFTALALALMLLFGMNFIVLGVIAEYVGRIYEEVKGRPTYISRTVARSRYASRK
ncbi:MAG: glycosyltransferase family 2 protein [Proteobacteria bacterium]|nr:glycosyltransferase family 2 protein [Pseudomonadota bacterium]